MASRVENITLRYCSTCILILICSLFFARANSIYKEEDDIPDCGTHAACKTVIEYGERMYSSKLDICKCRNETSCPTSNSIVRYIGVKNEPCPRFTMYYCKPLHFENIKTCKEGEVSMSFKGSKMLPSTVKEVFCRCPKSDPLHLTSIENYGFKKTEFYSCSMPACNTTDVEHVCRKNTNSKSAHFLCRCPYKQACDKQHPSISNSVQCQQVSHSV
ncbi:Hypothetical predicted protein [Octopus vulgaris]|uniref:Uncharacterized protein n=2 Tax=Octopus TaxID=6643 RepID=A0AA36B7I2_OCTVU|nr:uncharacterized protein LOC115215747 isoform X2 [Octopus sinensis]CAI9729024.1 Hypothetical predicted protein [Octopus vulgaris]